MGLLGATLLSLTVVGAIGAFFWYWRREQRVQITERAVRCPVHEIQARVSVRTDPSAQSCRQYLGVTTCSLLSDSAVGLPERTGYLSDVPMYEVRFDPPSSHAVYERKVDCPQHCVFVLNETAVTHTGPPMECTSGTSDAFDLARQATRSPQITRLLTYYGG